jgi:hypothetical protein
MSEPAFVVGNGGSLNDTDMDRLAGRTSYGMNRIHLQYGKPGCLRWRPTHYVFVDYQTTLTQDVVMEELAMHVRAGEEVYVGTELERRTMNKLQADRPQDLPPTIHFLQRCSRHFGGDYLSPSAPKRWHLDDPETPTCAFASGLFVAMQLAVLAGHNPIVLVGVDLGYRAIGDDGRDPNHMDPGYVQLYPHRGVTGRSVMPPGYDEYTNRKLRFGHRVALRSCRQLGVEVLNATAGGELEVYPRVRLEDLT